MIAHRPTDPAHIASPDPLEQALLGIAQHDFPLVPRPFAALAERLGCEEEDVLAAFTRMSAARLIGRIGAVYFPGTAGSSTLAALAVPEERLEQVAAQVSAYAEVNHNYEREHQWNMWFVVTAPDQERRDAVLEAIAAETGLTVLRLPMLEDYHLDLGFSLTWS